MFVFRVYVDAVKESTGNSLRLSANTKDMDVFEQKSMLPMLITKRVEPFDDPDYIYELKLDGIRCIAYLDVNGTELRGKQNRALLGRFPEMADMNKAAKKRCILDGELFIMREGKPSFEAIQPRLPLTNKYRIAEAAKRFPASYVAFDVMYCDGKQTTNLPLIDRKNLLSAIVEDRDRIAVSRFIPEHGTDLFNLTKVEGLEGIVAKKADSLYYPGKNTTQWVKIKSLIDDDYVVCGYIKKPDGLTSIVVAQYRRDKLIYKGHVTLGVRGEAFRRIKESTHLDTSPLAVPPGNEKAVWVEPRIVCAIQYMEITSGGGLRQAVLKGIRDDMDPEECIEK